MYCIKCGKQVEESWKNCPNCGASLESEKENEQTIVTREGAHVEAKKFFSKNKILLIVLAVAIVVIIAISSGGNTGTNSDVYSLIQDMTFDGDPESIGEIIDEDIESPEWWADIIDSTSKRVYVEGYSSFYEEDVMITFYYEETGDEYEVSLESMEFPDSGEVYTDSGELYVMWEMLYS